MPEGGTVARSRILRPGIRTLPVGTERYLVRGGGLVVFAAKAGDRIGIVDREGRQTCELILFDSEKRVASGIVGARASGDAAGTRAILARTERQFDGPVQQLRKCGLGLADLSSIDLFGDDSRPGAEVSFTVQENGVALVAAPGGPMRVDEQDPPTDLEVFVHRADPSATAEPRLPEPLADPRLDFRVNRSTARSYTVGAGEWIEIIDVEGRQCSDFQAFPVSQLDKGIERCLDVTTTRTLMAQAYPAPGLQSKYYDQDMRPLIEIVQDNCLRHDAFGLACAPKYYDDLGYPGHVNCSDNFNAALEPYPIAPRPGWMAMNFFYNTGVDERNQFYLDEPWSRPGDHVLLQALTDLVCLTSACPDDIDSANGWNPTDIHLRVYGQRERFKRSIGFRKRTDADVEMTKETGFHTRTSALTRSFVEYNGYWLPSCFVHYGAIEEYWACREKAVVMDLSALRKFEVLGPDSEKLLQYCLTRDVRRLATGQVVYTAMCYDTGTMIDDGTLFRLGRDNFRWIGARDHGGDWLREQAEKLGLETWVKSSTDQLHNLSVQGPKSRDILEQIIWTPPAQPALEELRWFRFTTGRIGDFQGIPLMVSRTGYTGELGYEVWCHPKDADALWDAIWRAGEVHSLIPLGLEALDMLRIEAGLIFAGAEFDDQTDPFEAGIGFAVPLERKEADFIGKEALIRRKKTPQRTLVGLELEGAETAAHGDCVHVGRHQVGMITSATRSPILSKNIALCRMAIEYAAIGTEVEVGKLDGHQKRIPSRVVAFPFYDPEKKRPRAQSAFRNKEKGVSNGEQSAD